MAHLLLPTRHFFARFALVCLCASTLYQSEAQITGGQHVFRFMSLPASARLTGLGGSQVSVQDEDIAFASANPAALSARMNGRLSFNHNFFLTDIQHGYFAYGHHLAKLGFTVHGAVQYVNYGDIKQADEFGVVTGTVQAGESAFTLGAARQLSDRLTLGLNARLGFSAFDAFQSTALSADVGLLYNDTTHLFSVGIVARNLGVQLNAYNEEKENLLADFQIGISKRLRHLPFRLSVVAQRLNQWDLRYDDPNAEDEEFLNFGGEAPKESKFNTQIDNLFRHLIFNGEFLFGRNEVFRVRLGYNHLRKKELSVRDYRSLAGFSGGFGFKINRFRLDMGYASYHLGGGVVHFGLGTNLRDFF